MGEDSFGAGERKAMFSSILRFSSAPCFADQLTNCWVVVRPVVWAMLEKEGWQERAGQRKIEKNNK
jgi:hypothetical protein